MSDLIQHLVPAYYAEEEKHLKWVFYDLLFRPLLSVLEKHTGQVDAISVTELTNMAPLEPLREALHTGQVQYDEGEGVFSGDFSASISRPLEQLGAQFDRRRKVYRIRPERVPSWIRIEAGAYKVTAREAHVVLQRTLNDIQADLAERVESLSFKTTSAASAVTRGFRRIANEIGIRAELNQASLDKIQRTYTENLRLKIGGFSGEMVESLREAVERNALNGYRFDKLVSGLKARYGASASKARFLAQNETSIFMATFRENRFAEVGVTQYRWSTSLDERVRDNPHGGDHKSLHGKTFPYASPPVVDHRTGRRCNPGKDYNCRCNDDPILPKDLMKEAA